MVKKIDNALSEIDDNMLQYCSLDKKVCWSQSWQGREGPLPGQMHETEYAEGLAPSPHFGLCAGIQAQVKVDARRERARIPGCFEGKQSEMSYKILLIFGNERYLTS